MIPKKLADLLDRRRENGTLRKLSLPDPRWVDFSTNDYLGLGTCPLDGLNGDADQTGKLGSGGSRLLGGNSVELMELERAMAAYYGNPESLIFNSGYDANLGSLASIPRKGDWVLYDEYVHASIRDGLGLTQARALKFRHLCMDDLMERALLIRQHRDWDPERSQIYVVTESVFSMDGDQADIQEILACCEAIDGWLLLDEAHRWELHDRTIQPDPWCGHPRLLWRLVTFGKALGQHGAAVLISAELKEFLVNYARSFIYTTALPPIWARQLLRLHEMASEGLLKERVEGLRERIAFFSHKSQELGLRDRIASPDSAIQSLVLGDARKVGVLAEELRRLGYFVKPIWSPTVPEGTERVRICLNSLHTFAALEGLLENIARILSE